jgi:transketolase
MEAEKYKKIAQDCRKEVLEVIYNAQTSHIGSNFSAIDILAVLFEKIDLDKDRFVLSAGWKAASLYYFLWKKGRITEKEFRSYCKEGSKFIGLAEPVIPDITLAGGSMGLGLPGAVGLALAKKLNKEDGKVYVLMSDGELAIGTTWESALIAAHHKLNNLVVIVDKNDYQAMGKGRDILDSYFPSENWHKLDIVGHDHLLIEKALALVDNMRSPFLIIAETTKGKGVSFMENNNLYHYKGLSEEEYLNALKEING